MKKRLVMMAMGALLALGAFGLMGCSGGGNAGSGEADSAAGTVPTGEVSVYSREDGSGTRGAFVELMGIEEKDASGEKVDMTTTSAAITNSTSVMMTSVAGDENGIGYISLGSLNDTVKALKIDGAEATAANVKSGDYQVARPFNIVTKDGLSDVAQDFIDFIMSSDGQKIVEEEGYISVADSAAAYTGSGQSGKIVIAGSSSVTPVMEKLKEAYAAVNPNAEIEVQQSDSTTGVNDAIAGTSDIGMASRALKDEELSGGLTATCIATDGIAVIVNKENSVDGLTSDQVKGIYTGEITDWSEVGGEAGKISCIGREAGSGTRDGFESITGTKDACKLDQELTSTGGVIEAVAGNANAIGYASLSAVEGKDTVKAVTVGGVACTEAAVLDGSYAIQRPFVLVTKTGATLSPAAQAFFDYATSPAANDLIKAAGAVPVAK